MERQKEPYELSAEEAKDIIRTYPEGASGGNTQIAGVIFDQDEARALLEWLCGDEGQALIAQLQAQRKDAHVEP